MKIYFDHEKLDVYRESIAFCRWVGELLGQISAKTAAKDQLDRASTSLPLNIAEGNGKFSKVDRSRFLKIAKRFSERATFLREDEGIYAIEYEYKHEHEHEQE